MLMPEEYEILRNMQVIDREVFYYLEQRMDRKTAVIGKAVKVSRSGIALDLSERSEPGRRRAVWVINASDVKDSLRRLCKAGLLRSETAAESAVLVFVRVFFEGWLLRDKSVQKQVPRQVPQGFPGIDSEIVNNNKALEVTKPENNQELPRQVPPTIYITSTTTDEFEKPVAMSIDWQPLETDLRALLFRSGGSKYKIEDIDQRWLGEFVGYWFSMPNRLMTPRQWTAKFASSVIRYFSDPDLVARKFGAATCGVAVGQQAAVEANHRALPDFAKLPRDDNALVTWSLRHGYGDPDPGDGWAEFRAKLKQKINRRLQAEGLAKVSW
jgi:hypothetical protein